VRGLVGGVVEWWGRKVSVLLGMVGDTAANLVHIGDVWAEVPPVGASSG
jgi:hypothetical protein